MTASRALIGALITAVHESPVKGLPLVDVPVLQMGIILGIEMVRLSPLYCRDLADKLDQEIRDDFASDPNLVVLDSFPKMAKRVLDALEVRYGSTEGGEHPGGETGYTEE